jgi:dihydrofolate synthase/folylpolyglutamate synthase
MNFEETIEYLYSLLPMYQRVGNVAYKKDLTNTLALCKALANPHHKFRSVHIAGTNGKGSSAHMLASILQTAGYHTGLYTSPHLKNFTERIKLNGIEVEQSFVVDFVKRLKNEIERIQPSFFEITVAMAFDYFARNQVDIAIIETGLGGRLDSTNIISPEVSLITNIGMDHMDMLGDTLPKIALEKAGIIKREVPVVISEFHTETYDVFRKKAEEEHASIYFAQEFYHFEHVHYYPDRVLFDLSITDLQGNTEKKLEHLYCDLSGSYQIRNIGGVLKTLELLNPELFVVDWNHIRRGLATIVENTGMKGRWQTLKSNPWVICDTAHNMEAIQYVMEGLAQHRKEGLHIVWGMVKDKDVKRIIRLLPKDAIYYFCAANIPRALPAKELKDKFAGYDLIGEAYSNVNEAYQTALEKAGENDLIFIGGSSFVVAELNDL